MLTDAELVRLAVAQVLLRYIGCGQSKTTTERSNLFGWAGYG